MFLIFTMVKQIFNFKIQWKRNFSDYFLEDATFLRCENIVIGYRFNKFYKNFYYEGLWRLNNPFIFN